MASRIEENATKAAAKQLEAIVFGSLSTVQVVGAPQLEGASEPGGLRRAHREVRAALHLQALTREGDLAAQSLARSHVTHRFSMKNMVFSCYLHSI